MEELNDLSMRGWPKVVIIGCGFGGLALARRLVKQKVEVLLIDRNNYHTFQPLLYQVATGNLEPDSIAFPIRRIFSERHNFHFRMAEVESVDVEKKRIKTSVGYISYDQLVIATGTKSAFYNLEEVKQRLMPLKSVAQALDLRSLILQSFEKCMVLQNKERQKSLLNFVIVGGGPTGVELAGALAEMKKYMVPEEYPELNIDYFRINLLEMKDKVLSGMSEKSSAAALKYLQDLGVQVYLKTTVTDYRENKLVLNDKTAIAADNIIWTAGVTGAVLFGLPQEVVSKSNRFMVDRYNRVQKLNDIFVIGDVAQMATDKFPDGHPQLAPVAVQQGKHLAKNLKRYLKGREMKPFEYRDKGVMATIGRNRAVAEIGNMFFKGFIGWFIWMFVHILFLLGFRNKIVVFINWVWNYLTYHQSLHLIIRPYKRNVVKRE